MKKSVLALAVLCASLSIQVNGAAIDDGTNNSVQAVNQVVQWNKNLLLILRTPGAQPATIHPTRSYAIMHAAIYDAVNAIDRTHEPYLVRLSHVPHDASKGAAAAAAAHEVLVKLYPKLQAALDAELTQSLSQVEGEEEDTREGVEIGMEVADQILALRSNDGSNATPPAFVPGIAPGDYQLTPPNFPKPAFTHWSTVTPFALQRADQFRPGPPPSLTSDTYTDAFNEIKPLGSMNSTTRTADQTVIGKFWNGAIQNYWNEITQTASLAYQLNTAQSARLFALLNLSIADSVIAFYDAKYTYAFWRPVTAIRAADTDGNPDTIADPNWLPQNTNTAPDPSYPGAHATISNTAALVLISFFEHDRFPLAVTSETLPGVVRSFPSFSAAADEATASRVIAGQHFRFDEDAGRNLGRKVGDFVQDHFLLPRGHGNEDFDQCSSGGLP
jgi:hypothetical protein